MKKSLALAGVAAAVFAATGAFAAEDMFVSGSGDQWKLYGGTAPAEGTVVLKAEAGKAPANCPEGSYWINDKQMILACRGNEEFGFATIPQGTSGPPAKPTLSTPT